MSHETHHIPFVTTAEAATIIGVSLSFLHKRWKGIPASRRLGKVLRWDIEELRTWMKIQAQEARCGKNEKPQGGNQGA